MLYKNQRTSTNSGILITLAIVALCAVRPAFADDVVQIDVKSILTTRSVTTLTGGTIVPWIIGVDGGGTFAGYMTLAAALKTGSDTLALPDNGVFPATTRLPRVALNYSNDADSKSNQTWHLLGLGQLSFTVPPNNYSKMFVFLTLGDGDYELQKIQPNLRVTLTYDDGTVSTDYKLMDYAANYPDDDTNFCNLISNRTKWSQKNQVAESGSIGNHTIHALNVHPDVKRILTSIKVEKTKLETRWPPQVGFLVFWGATGLAPNASPVKGQPVVVNNEFSLFGRTRVISTGQGLRFVNLPSNIDIGIYSVTGRLVAHLSTTEAGAMTWAPITKITAGAYMCALHSGPASKNIKVLVGE
jgi:hypothetical protein